MMDRTPQSSPGGSGGSYSHGPMGLRELLDSAPDTVFCCDDAGHVVWLGQAFEYLTGRNPSTQIGRPYSTLVPPSDHRRVSRQFFRHSRRMTDFVLDIPLITAAGGEVKASVHVRPVLRPDGGIAFVGVARKTEERSPEARYAPVPASDPSRESLLNTIVALEMRIEELKAELEDSMSVAQLKGEFLSTMSHELRTPMNGMMGMTHLLLETQLDRDQRGMVEVIQHSGNALLNLVNDTLDFSKAEAGKLEMEWIDFDLRVTVHEIISMLAPIANEKQIGLECRVHHEVPSLLRGDPGRVRQVLLNLCGNAVKFTDAGQVMLGIQRVFEDDDRVALRFTVSDTGNGIPRDQKQRLFQAYEQGDPSVAGKYGGTGLGLAISRKLVELLGGTVGVESVEGHGSTFWFEATFRKQAHEVTPVHAAPTAPDVQIKNLRVLVVDPSCAMSESLIEKLNAWGCRADAVDSPARALELLRHAAGEGDPYRAALIELQLGENGDGEALGRAIREDRSLDATLMLLMTSVGRRGDAARARENGFSAYLMKPLDWTEMSAALIEVLHNDLAHPGDSAPLVTRHSLAEARRSRTRILLVEDNAVNQMVADWALRRHGYAVDIQGTGAGALGAFAAQRYALVLLDIQIPDKDGFALAVEMRELETRMGLPPTPLVAMTGHAGPADRDRCLAAGMDDYLPKPVDLELLCKTVGRWTGGEVVDCTDSVHDDDKIKVIAQLAGDAYAPREPEIEPLRMLTPAEVARLESGASIVELVQPMPREPLDMAQLEAMCMGIPALRDTLLNTFLTEIRPRLERMIEAHAARDARRIEFEAHSLKGMAATIGATACAEIFSDLEDLAREDRLVGLAPHFKHAVLEVYRAEKFIAGLDRDALAA